MCDGGELVIYTPGHSLYTDTLITYGIAYPMIRTIEEPEEILKVFGTGLNYAITIRGVGIDHLAQAIANYVIEKSNSFKRELMVIPRSEAKTRADGRVGLLSGNDVLEFVKVLRNKAGVRKYLESLRSPAHAKNEGKTGKGVKSKLKLSLMPTAGKYLPQDLTTNNRYSDNRYYRVCEYCSAFAALGLYCGALTARLREWALIIFLGFEGEVGGGALNQALHLIRSEADTLANLPAEEGITARGRDIPLSLELGLSMDVLPLRTLSQAMLCLFTDSAIKGISESNASWKSLSVKFNATRAKSGNLQVRGYEEVLLTPVVDALADLMRDNVIVKFRERVRWLLRAARSRGPESGDAITALESIFTFFQTRRLSDLYSFVRSYEVSMKNFSKSSEYRLGLSREVCEELAKLSTRP